MQTFLPYPSFEKSAKSLDNKRLGKQRVECMQILKALLGESKGWVNHPATQMWRGYEDALLAYMFAVVNEWQARGFANSKIDAFLQKLKRRYKIDWKRYKAPVWLGSRKFHASHRSNLLRKDAKHYGKFGWKESSTLPYVWPTK